MSRIGQHRNEHDMKHLIVDETGKTIPCLENCARILLKTEISQADYPNQKNFYLRPDLCLIYEKVVRVCKNVWKRELLEEWFEDEYQEKFDCEKLIYNYDKGKQNNKKDADAHNIINLLFSMNMW